MQESCLTKSVERDLQARAHKLLFLLMPYTSSFLGIIFASDPAQNVNEVEDNCDKIADSQQSFQKS